MTKNISRFAVEGGNGGVAPSVDIWLREAKTDSSASGCGMYLIHNGVVRQTARAKVRLGEKTAKPVTGLLFSYDEEKVSAAAEKTYQMPGICYIRVWLNSGKLSVGDDIMQVLIGGDIRPHVVDALQALVEQIKSTCVTETELF
ncbi:molybdenum cofactor biosynthesis protein MoaE [Ruminococcus gauvreauii]|uniref:Molybdenum cofactor biosynthesis protein MoaE n=1 Tax=Ruminococcus gauvreauii TaxID=438033 RepID=A0ABY5VIC5_9FIRM|nr:molybdenum cofactor biosynthesis protein MoaE [Ruminococcus gauvreauii]UWP59929.1 molybdenum cofactor biosynthesis protein MoaE [Ruminococcus gauvreauii]